MRKLLLVSALVLAAGVAQADNTGLYVGAGLTRGNVDNIVGSGLDIHKTDWKAIVGFRPISPFAVEVNYLDLGSETRSFNEGVGEQHADAKAFAGYAVGFLPLPLPIVDIYGKAGLARWQLSGSAVHPNLFALSDHGTQFAYGAGAQAHFGNLAARLEYEHFDISNTDGARIYTLGVTLNLL